MTHELLASAELPLSPEQAREGCQQIIDVAKQDIIDHVDNNKKVPEEAVYLNRLFHQYAFSYLCEGRFSRLRRSIRIMQKMPEATEIELLELCFQGAQLSHEHTTNILHTLLESEKEKALRDNPDIIQQPRLGNIVSMCSRQKLPADYWINMYAHDKNIAWILTVDHYNDMKPNNSAFYTQRLTEKAHELCNDPQVDPHSLVQLARFFISTTNNSEAYEPLIAKCINNIATGQVHTPAMLMSIMDMIEKTAQVNRKGTLFSQQAFTAIDQLVQQVNSIPEVSKENKHFLQLKQAKWRCSYGFYVNNNMDSLTYTKLVEHVTRDVDISQQEKDALMGLHLNDFVQQGDYTSAQVLASTLPTEFQLNFFNYHLSSALSSEQLNALRPNDSLLKEYPWIKMNYELAHALVDKNISTIIPLSRQYMDGYAEAEQLFPAANVPIIRALHAVKEQQNNLMVPFIRSLRLPLRNNSSAQKEEQFRFLSDNLVLAGDKEELQYRWQQLNDINSIYEKAAQAWILDYLLDPESN